MALPAFDADRLEPGESSRSPSTRRRRLDAGEPQVLGRGTKTIGLVGVDHDASTPSIKLARVAGRQARRPVPAPPGSRKSSVIRAPAAGNAGQLEVRRRRRRRRRGTGTWATMSFLVLVLWDAHRPVLPSAAFTSRSSIAKGPTADEQLPQLAL